VPKAILFDLDSTIITWETPPEIIWNSVCRRYMAELSGLEPADVYQAIRSVSDWYWSDPERHRTGRLDLPAHRRKIVRMAFSRLHRDDFDLADKIADAYSVARQQGESLVPGAIATLKGLRQRGISLALVTNGGSAIQWTKINKFRLAPYFDNILIEGEFGCGKPDERVFLHTLKTLNVTPADAWMVGDDLEFDIAPCRVLGIYALWVDGRGKGLPVADGARPDRIIRNISEIPGLL
jgi:putative hydrolase of the HAD superfamily